MTIWKEEAEFYRERSGDMCRANFRNDLFLKIEEKIPVGAKIKDAKSRSSLIIHQVHPNPRRRASRKHHLLGSSLSKKVPHWTCFVDAEDQECE